MLTNTCSSWCRSASVGGSPGAKSWTVLAKGVPLEAINERKLDHPFSRFAKYLLIETDIADPGPLFGLYVYGDRPAVNYQLHKREAAIDTHAIFGPYVNAATTYSVSALYAHSTVSYANASGGFASWQKAIDENPESSVNILPTTDEAGMVVKLAAGHQLGRFAVLTGAPAKGKLDFFVVPAAPSDAAGSDITKASNSTSPAASEVAKAPSLAGLTPTISLVLDGSTTRSSIDFPKTEGSAVMLRWTPETAGSPISIRELNAFNEVSLNEYELALTPEAVAELRSGGKRVTGNGYDAGKDGKDYKDGKDLPPVGEFLSPRSPYLPGGLGFPPNVTRRVGGPGPTPVSP